MERLQTQGPGDELSGTYKFGKHFKLHFIWAVVWESACDREWIKRNRLCATNGVTSRWTKNLKKGQVWLGHESRELSNEKHTRDKLNSRSLSQQIIFLLLYFQHCIYRYAPVINYLCKVPVFGCYVEPRWFPRCFSRGWLFGWANQFELVHLVQCGS